MSSYDKNGAYSKYIYVTKERKINFIMHSAAYVNSEIGWPCLNIYIVSA